MTGRILLSPPDVGDLEAKYVLEALNSGWVAPAGPDLTCFESEVADRVGVSHAVGVSSGTAALHLALLALDVGPGDVVITSAMTFVATANAITYTGARPFFVDSDPVTGNIDIALLWRAAERVRASERRIGAILPVDLLGKCADMDGVAEVAGDYEAPLLVDSAESFGASWCGRPAGSFGDASVLSFNGNKIMTTSGGGMLLSDNEQIAERARYLATQARQPVAHYEHTEVGYNYRLSNVLAALGRAQLCRLDEMIARRRAIRAAYRKIFAAVPGVRIFGGADDREDACWLTGIVVDPGIAGWTAAQLAAALADARIETRPLWKPMHLQPAFAGAEAVVNGVSQRFFENGLTLPSGSSLSAADIAFVHGQVSAFLAAHDG